jgi:outer membrane protein TolC
MVSETISRTAGSGAAATLVSFLFLLTLASAGHAADTELTLPEVVRQALASNLDLVAQRQSLAAAREEIGLSRSALLPQVGVGARAQVLDSDRSDSERGNNKSESVLVAAGLTQVLYDEKAWAGFDVQKHVYDGQVQQLESFQLGVVQEAADAFLELARAHRVLEIQRDNREVTRQNLEKSRARIAAGWSSKGEILRWQSQLAGNDIAVRAAEVLALQSRFELNRIRHLSPEAEGEARPATVEEHGFLYARAATADALVRPEQDRRMRDFMVRVGLRRSPELAALTASIAAAERQLTANRRAFWVPSLSFNAGVDYSANQQSSEDDFNQTEWGVKGLLTFPLFEGGAKFAGLDQARETLASLITQRSATSESLGQTIRSAFAQATGSFESVGFAGRQLEAARRNFELVDASYTLGVSSLLDLLDAQSQLLASELDLANATYDFLEDLVAAERGISLYPFLEAPGDVESLLRQLEQELALQP